MPKNDARINPLFPIPDEFAEKVVAGHSHSISCGGDCCDDCVDVHQLATGEVLLVNSAGIMVLSKSDFEGIQKIQL